ncbi:MAG: hypothetical protein CVU15_08840 [Betaproteobacteria bacterium HGW-Betaproteobacteria-1]|jgi:hypothetical protein|nr:MAG: hypothetical protein CVU15_08840 [Betaproteobacteria bacterium HGW-Betaproteobacteria-1]
MKSMKFASIAILAALLGACSNQPVGKWQERSQQMKLNAVQHWGLIAADAVEQTRLAVSSQEQIKNRPLFVTDNKNTHFDRAFRNYMITGLVNAGLAVSDRKEGAVEISYESQVIRHGASFDPSVFGYKPGIATGGVAGFWVLRNASTTGIAAGTLAAAAGYDLYKVTEPTGVELLLTTSIVSENQYVMRNTDAYYIEKADAYLFEPCKSRSATGCRPKYPLK